MLVTRAQKVDSMLLKTGEKLINRVIEQDERASLRLQALQGQSLCLQLIDWDWSCLLVVADNGVLFTPNASNHFDADVVVAGRGVDLLGLLLHGDELSAMQEGDISITGRLSVAQSLQVLLSELAIDWEGLLSSLMGNVMAHEVSSAARAGRRTLRRFANKASQDFSDVLHDEMGLAPDPKAIADFCDQVAVLRAAAGRVLQLLHQNAKQQKD